ncbi:MAG: hypothetical protein KBT21_08600 [Treponema sp.]|nr:hypothetical protein [Candidatus Treponema merdequi]
MRTKTKGYIVTWEKGNQRCFKTISEMEQVLDLSHVHIVKHIQSGESTTDRTTNEKIWIEELA